MWTAADLAAAASLRPESIAHLGLRTTSPVAADALSLAATSGRLTAPELLDRLGVGTAGTADQDEVLSNFISVLPVAAGLALLWCGSGAQSALHAGAAVYRWLVTTGAAGSLHPMHHHAAGQALYLTGDTRALHELLPILTKLPPDVRHYLATDLAHPGPAPDGAFGADAHARWEALLSARFVEHDLTPLSVGPRGYSPHLFDQLGAATDPGRVHGPLVTVIMPCYRPDQGLFTSVASVVAQTWADLEIVIVDDASGPEYQELIRDAAALDPRVRVLTLERNGGSYLARRAALTASRGALVTTQDVDDWSHPERLERQVALLQEHSAAPASRSRAVRAKDDLTHQWFGYGALRVNASSLMFRRDVLDSHGSFLRVRKSADSEFAERLESLVGPIADTPAPLAITRLRDGSLSRGDFSYQWSHPDRLAFRGTYRAWHRTLATTGVTSADVDLMLEVPPAFARGIPGAVTAPTTLDLCLLGDFRDPPTADTGRPAAARAVLDHLVDMQVGLWHVERPLALTRARPEMHPDWFDLTIGRPDVHLVTRTLDCEVGTLVVLDPAALLLATAQPASVRPHRVEVVLDNSVLDPGPGGLPTDLLGVSDACLEWFGRRPTWRSGPGICVAEAADLHAGLPGLPIEPWPTGTGRA